MQFAAKRCIERDAWLRNLAASAGIKCRWVALAHYLDTNIGIASAAAGPCALIAGILEAQPNPTVFVVVCWWLIARPLLGLQLCQRLWRVDRPGVIGRDQQQRALFAKRLLIKEWLVIFPPNAFKRLRWIGVGFDAIAGREHREAHRLRQPVGRNAWRVILPQRADIIWVHDYQIIRVCLACDVGHGRAPLFLKRVARKQALVRLEEDQNVDYQ